MKKSAQELLKECIDRGIECAMETPAEDCRVPFDIGTEIQFDIWDEIRSAFYFEYESVIKRKTHEEMLMDISDWVNDDSNTEVAPEKKPWAWLNDKEIDEIKQTAPAYVSAKAVNTVVDMVEEKLNQKYEWGDDDSNTHVAPAVESNTPVAIVRDWGRIEWQEGVFPSLGAKLYMSPQESEKPAWIPLNITERNRIIDEWNSLVECTVRATKEGRITMLCKMIEARLKELNT